MMPDRPLPDRPLPGSPAARDRSLVRQSRVVAVVIASAGVLWVGGQALVAWMGWNPSYAILFDLVALAAFFWALVVTWWLWQARKNGKN
ncbi:MAG: DUF5337 domain-containing protein [Pseudomonadota bacterium]